MDTPQATTHVSLCAGYGGIDLGLKRAIPNLRTVAFSEIEAFAVANLVAKMEAGLLDPAPIWTDLKTFPWEEFRDRVGILSGGYPCQPFSSAGKRLGKDDPRHLWPFIADGIRRMQPAVCFFENVEGHVSLGLREVIGELESLGYAATWGLFSAAEVGAPHQRKRVFILAYRDDEGFPRHWRFEQIRLSQGWEIEEGCPSESGQSESTGLLWPSRPGQPQHEWEPPRVVGNACGNGLERQRDYSASEHRTESGLQLGSTDGYNLNAGQTEPALGGNADGPAGGMDYAELCVSCDNRTDELRLLGNGVVPATAERAFRYLINTI